MTRFALHFGCGKSHIEIGTACGHIICVSVANKDRRKKLLVARVSGSDKLLFTRAAALEGMSVAAFVITHARDVAHRIVANADEIKLDAAQSRRFVEALLKPKPLAPVRLWKAAKEHRQRIVSR